MRPTHLTRSGEFTVLPAASSRSGRMHRGSLQQVDTTTGTQKSTGKNIMMASRNVPQQSSPSVSIYRVVVRTTRRCKGSTNPNQSGAVNGVPAPELYSGSQKKAHICGPTRLKEQRMRRTRELDSLNGDMVTGDTTDNVRTVQPAQSNYSHTVHQMLVQDRQVSDPFESSTGQSSPAAGWFGESQDELCRTHAPQILRRRESKEGKQKSRECYNSIALGVADNFTTCQTETFISVVVLRCDSDAHEMGRPTQNLQMWHQLRSQLNLRHRKGNECKLDNSSQ